MSRYDHFHAEVELADGTMTEIEGGIAAWPPKGWKDMDYVTREHTLVQLTASWMDKPVNIRCLGRFRLGDRLHGQHQIKAILVTSLGLSCKLKG